MHLPLFHLPGLHRAVLCSWKEVSLFIEQKVPHIICKLEGHLTCFFSCNFYPNSALLATASYTTKVITRDPYTGHRLRALHPSTLMGDSDVPRRRGRRQTPQELGLGAENSSCICSYDQWSLMHIFSTWWSYWHRNKRWSLPILDSS